MHERSRISSVRRLIAIQGMGGGRKWLIGLSYRRRVIQLHVMLPSSTSSQNKWRSGRVREPNSCHTSCGNGGRLLEERVTITRWLKSPLQLLLVATDLFKKLRNFWVNYTPLSPNNRTIRVGQSPLYMAGDDRFRKQEPLCVFIS
jgi:hypothetical protein